MRAPRFAVCCLVPLAALSFVACDDDPAAPADAGVDMALGDYSVKDGPRPETSADGPQGDGLVDALPPDTKPKPPARWDKAADMLEARSWHTATLLLDGTVLVAGGIESYKGVQTGEIYDPTTNAWTAAGTMVEPHWAHRAERLDDGRVLIIGGCGSGPSNLCMNGVGVEIYNPKNTTTPWSKTSPMLASRRSHCSTKLKDGRILVAGGFNSSKNHTGLEIYDPKLGTWTSPIAKLSTARNLATATTLKTGQVLIVGGFDGAAFLNTMELFDPTAGTIKVLSANLIEARDSHTATLLDNGQVLITGGYCKVSSSSSCQVSDAELYDPVNGKILPGGSPGTVTYSHTATLLKSGAVLVAGGVMTAKLAKLFTAAGWSQTVSMSTGREIHAAVRLDDGRVMVSGGEPGSSYYGQTSVEIYTP